jgi:acetyl-CoA C-acetyltransferase
LDLCEWTPFDGHRDFLRGQRSLTNELEARHGLTAPIQCYPLFENALRAKAGRTIDEHQQWLSVLMARYAAVAASNPCAWFPIAWTAEEIRTVTVDNRWICFPYPKRMNAINEVDQAAACVVMSGEAAARHGIRPAQCVTFLGGASAVDAWTPTERPDFISSPAYLAAATTALNLAGVDQAKVDLFDLYSCFPSAVQFALEALGIAADDARPLTVTGGLPYAGGPGNSYSMHALAAMVERLRRGEGRVGYVSAMGMAATKHAVSVVSVDPAYVPAAEGASTKVTLPEWQRIGPPLAEFPEGSGTIETYTVEYSREGGPVRSILVVRLDDGRRTVANGDSAAGGFRRLTDSEGVGLRGQVAPGAAGTPNVFVLDT